MEHKRGAIVRREWYKWGVRVTKEFCQQDFDKLDLKKVFAEEKNSQMLMVYIRQIGIENVLKRIGGKMLEMTDDGEYILYETNLMGVRVRFIRMICPSSNSTYMIPTHPDKNLDEALTIYFRQKRPKFDKET